MSGNKMLFAVAYGWLASPFLALHTAPVKAQSKAQSKARRAVSKTVKAPSTVARARSAALQEVKSEGVTIRLRRARWARSEEVTGIKGRGKQLTLWFDALLDPKITLPKGATPTDYIVNVQVLDLNKRPVQVFPIEPLKSWHRSSLPYTPAKEGFQAQGQSVWCVQPFDPRVQEVTVQIEWLRPNHPFERKTLPPSLLKFDTAPDSPESRQWLQVLEIKNPRREQRGI